VYDYANAFAINKPAAAQKTMERTAGSVAANFRPTSCISLVGAFTYNDVTSNDARLAYNRNQFALSLRWEQ
jgi:hypothetical protein